MIGTAAATAALSLAAIGSAQATTWTWATQGNPLVMTGGKGFGSGFDPCSDAQRVLNGRL